MSPGIRTLRDPHVLVTCINERIWEDGLTVFCGIDWAERHHDVAVVDDTGTLLAKARVSDDAAGYSKLFVGRRFVKNNRLMHAGFLWAFSALQASPGANAHYRRRREHGDWHNAAQRHLLNRFLGQLHHCLQNRQPFDEQRAFATRRQATARPGVDGCGGHLLTAQARLTRR